MRKISKKFYKIKNEIKKFFLKKPSKFYIIKKPEKTTISLLMCTYNHAHYLESYFDSILSQNRLPNELLIMNDGSTDNTQTILNYYANKYDWIKIHSKNNGGYINGVAELTELAKGDFLHRGATDDYMHPTFIDRTMEYADYFPSTGIVSSELSGESDDGYWKSVLNIPGWEAGFFDGNAFMRDCLLVCPPTGTLAPSTIFRRDAVKDFGGWRPALGIWDVSFILQAAALKFGMCYINEPLYTWYMRKSGWTMETQSNFENSKRIYLEYYNLISSKEYQPLFGDIFPKKWLRSNLYHAVDELVSRI